MILIKEKQSAPTVFGGTLLNKILLKNYLLTDDTCTADDQSAIVDQLIQVGLGEHRLDGGL